MDALYSRLAEADETEDAAALATLAWQLYGLVGSLAADRSALRAELQQMATTLGSNRSATRKPRRSCIAQSRSQ